MKKLIKMYNEKYGDTLGIIDDDFNKEQMYRIYYFIKNNCNDKDIQDRIKMINLDKPKTLEQQLTKLESEHNEIVPSDNKIAYTVSSKVLTTISPKDIKLNGEITVNNVSINKDKRYYIEFLGSKKLCSLLINEKTGNGIICSIGNYIIQAYNYSPDIMIDVNKINADDTTTITFTDLVIYEEEVKYLNSKYIETDLVLQNSISMGRVGKIGAGSSAIGVNVIASGDSSHAEGNETTSSGMFSHVEGYKAISSGMSSHAEGGDTTASGMGSHAEGVGTTASATASHAEGSNTIASSESQHVQGKYNIEDNNKKYAHIVGNGEYGKKSNAHTLDWEGNAWFAGKLSQEGTPTEDKDLTTKKYVDDKVSSLPQFSFNKAGELVVTINGVSKTFVPKSE